MISVISPTTQWQVYNTLGPGSNWYNSRWGPRPVPELDLEWDTIKHLSHLHLVCVYGDPQCWKDFHQACASGKPMIVETYLPPTPSNKNIHWVINVDGTDNCSGKVYLGQQWPEIQAACELMPKQVTIRLALWHHNQHQVDAVQTWCEQIGCELELVTGDHSSDVWSPVINQYSEWLYCVQHVDPAHLPESVEPELYRHLESYNSLRTYVNPPRAKSIIHKPMITPYDPVPEWTQEFQNIAISQDEDYWTPSGHQFTDGVLWGVFMDLLAADWKFDKATVVANRHDKWFQEQVFWARYLYKLIQ